MPDDPALAEVLTAYFPSELGERFGDAFASHPLRREIIATMLANDVVNMGGAAYVFRAMEETGATAAEVARAFVALRRVYQLDSYVEAVNALPASFDTAHWVRLHGDLRRLLDRTTRWFVEHGHASGPIAEAIDSLPCGVSGASGTSVTVTSNRVSA